jgi:glycosyltransferase involved in cell wall biosynthesis
VCSDIHGYKGVVRRDRDALLVPPREPKRLAAAIGRLIADDDLRSQMAESGRERAADFSWERVTAKVEDYYGFVIRRLEAQAALPPGFHAGVPPPARAQPGVPADTAV